MKYWMDRPPPSPHSPHPHRLSSLVSHLFSPLLSIMQVRLPQTRTLAHSLDFFQRAKMTFVGGDINLTKQTQLLLKMALLSKTLS